MQAAKLTYDSNKCMDMNIVAEILLVIGKQSPLIQLGSRAYMVVCYLHGDMVLHHELFVLKKNSA